MNVAVLDFEQGKVFIYKLSQQTESEILEFLETKHGLDNCQYMIGFKSLVVA